MNKTHGLKLTILCLYIIIIIILQMGCSQHKLTGSDAEQNAKAFLDKKYEQDFTVKLVKKTEEKRGDPLGYIVIPEYFYLEATSNGKIYNVVYGKDTKGGKSLSVKGENYPYSDELIEENIEGKDWKKEIYNYYSKKIGEYCDDGNLKDVNFGLTLKRTPSRIGMSAEEYINELYESSVPQIDIQYTIFVDDINSVRYNENILNKIDDAIRIKGDNDRKPDMYFTECFLIVSKKDKEEYIKKVDEYNKICSDYYNSESYDPSDRKTYDEYWAKVQFLSDWFKSVEQDSCNFKYSSDGHGEFQRNWRKK